MRRRCRSVCHAKLPGIFHAPGISAARRIPFSIRLERDGGVPDLQLHRLGENREGLEHRHRAGQLQLAGLRRVDRKIHRGFSAPNLQ